MNKNILIVEDDADLREWISYELEAEGFDVQAASNGLAGLEAARLGPDLVILDVQLPEMSGFQICTALKSDPATRHIPVIFLTARTQLSDKLEGFDVGGTDYLVKPFKFEELRARVRAILHTQTEIQQQVEAEVAEIKRGVNQNFNHELVTPLSIILGSLEILETRAANQTQAESDQLIQNARKGAIRMHGVVQDLLMMRRLEQDRFVIFPTGLDLRMILNIVVESIQLKYRDKRITLDVEFDRPTMIWMQQDHLNNILRQLLDNAFKFSPTGGHVKLTVESSPTTGTKIWVQDEGIGIELGEREKIFDKFYQIDMSATRHADGIGSGLYLARKLAKIYQSEILVHSMPGIGSTFCLSIPPQNAIDRVKLQIIEADLAEAV